jgi:hypothetical protein
MHMCRLNTFLLDIVRISHPQVSRTFQERPGTLLIQAFAQQQHMAGNSSQWSGVGPNFQQRGGVQEGHHRWWPLNKEGERFVRLRRSNDEYRYWLYAANPPPSKHGGP